LNLKRTFLIRSKKPKKRKRKDPLTDDSKNLSSEVEIQNQASNSLSSFLILRKSSFLGLSSEASIRNIGSIDFSSSAIVRNAGSLDLSSSFVLRNASSSYLSGEAVVQNSSSQVLSFEFILRNLDSKDLSSSFLLRNSDSENFPESVVIRNKGIKNLSSSTVLRKETSKDLRSFFYMNPNSRSYRCSVILRHEPIPVFCPKLRCSVIIAPNKNLPSSCWIGYSAGEDFSVNSSIRKSGLRNLSLNVEISPFISKTKNLSCSFNVKNANIDNLSCSFSTLEDSHRLLREDDFVIWITHIEGGGIGSVGLPTVTDDAVYKFSGANSMRISPTVGSYEWVRAAKHFGI